ncbi:TPA-induced transmembrane protein isoform X2 [Ascaphus truei]|uniref:TPA-induced transmembrane protein isoform X2 n=1 Tax=Ascaphus truei TaxID=8439 RepID=UPI003F59FC12
MEMFQKTEEEVCNTLLKTNKNWKQDKCNDNVWGKCKLWMTITFVFIMVAVITTLSLILYSQVYIDDDKFNQELPLNKSKCIFTGSLNISNSCIHMWEPLIRTKTELMNRIANAYRLSPALQHYFISVDMISDENTSAAFRLNFSSSSKNKNGMKYTMSEEFIGGVLRQGIYDQEKTGCENPRISLDPSYFTLYLLQVCVILI